MSGLFQIKPLDWREDEPGGRYSAQTPFGSYSVYKTEYNGWRWGYCFVEYHDEDSFSCDDIGDGQQKAWENWLERISGALSPSQCGGA